jgi:hypothetical protein
VAVARLSVEDWIVLDDSNWNRRGSEELSADEKKSLLVVEGGFFERAAAMAPESSSPPPPSSSSEPADAAGRFRIFFGGFRMKLHTGAEAPAPSSPPPSDIGVGRVRGYGLEKKQARPARSE